MTAEALSLYTCRRRIDYGTVIRGNESDPGDGSYLNDPMRGLDEPNSTTSEDPSPGKKDNVRGYGTHGGNYPPTCKVYSAKLWYR